MTSAAPITVNEAACRYIRAGLSVVPVAHKGKRPIGSKWQKLRIVEAELPNHFNGKPRNIGILLGEPSGGLTDVDLDVAEAAILAPTLLPPTGITFGRRGKPRSHYVYTCAPVEPTAKFAAPDGTMLVELRSTGAQTVFPPSIHESGEQIEFCDKGKAATIEGNVLAAHVAKLAAATLLARRWPAEGSRHTAAMALAGGLTRAGWAEEDVVAFVTAVAMAAGDDQVKDRQQAARDTFGKLGTSEKSTGWPSLITIVGKEGVNRICTWLGVDRKAPARQEMLPTVAPAEATAVDEGAVVGTLDKYDPLPAARKFLRELYQHIDGPTLLHSGDVFYVWMEGNAYVELEPRAVRAALYPWLERHQREEHDRTGDVRILPFQPTNTDVDRVVDALKALTYTTARAPSWLNSDPALPDPAHLLIARNGIFDLGVSTDRPLRLPTPLLFTTNILDYDYDPAAPEPVQFVRFLDTLWHDDPEAISLLQEWFGYCLTPDTRQEKILMLIGPKRSGKGTIARILRRLIGVANVSGPTLAGLATNFGLWDLINKSLAIISDARLGNRVDQSIITERLLAISGEDALTVDRKNLQPVTLKLPTRIMLCTNELPKLTDASGALADRFLILVLEKSFLGKEDVTLTDRLLSELPGILCWAVKGWQRLRQRGRFLQPGTGQSAMDELHDLASPISAFIRDCCTVQTGQRVPMKDLYDAWCAWCRQQGREHAGTVQVFGRDLRAALPGIGTSQPTVDGERIRHFDGIGLTISSQIILSHERSARQQHNGTGRVG